MRARKSAKRKKYSFSCFLFYSFLFRKYKYIFSARLLYQKLQNIFNVLSKGRKGDLYLPPFFFTEKWWCNSLATLQYKSPFSILKYFHMKYMFLILSILCLPLWVHAAKILSSSTGSIVSVTDWDTLKVQLVNWTWSETIRLLWFDAPESFATRFGYIECYGAESSDYLKQLLPVGTEIYLEFYGNDKYSRDLADVYVWTKSGMLVTQNMLSKGFGWVYTKWIKTNNYSSLLTTQVQAKTSKVWLWNTVHCNGKRVKIIPPKKTETITSSTIIPAGIWISDSFSCSRVPRYCSWVRTREEAQFYLNSCRATRFDRDNDGLACEDIE